ncbi:hypothetical protein V5O48_001938 [Marasmius crinis-equi]|uniref:F-box domain-containing protein n=1 Tax=Marasmius crinis-equi TaxID=585013 RepID=A0ABR3FXT8_9AGAR
MAETSKPSRYLPNELLTYILRSCGPREQAVLCRTSKGFRAIVQGSLYEHIKLGSPVQAESFSRTILKGDQKYSALIKDLKIVIISSFNSNYDSKSFITLLNLVLQRLKILESLRISLEIADKSYLHLALSDCTFPNLRTFHFGQTGEISAPGVLQFLKRHPSLKNLSIDTDEYMHPIVDHPDYSDDVLVLAELESYSGPLNFLKFFAKKASSLSSVLIKLKVKNNPASPATIPVGQLGALEKIPGMGRGVSLAFETSASFSRILQWTSAALPKLHSLAVYSRNGDALRVRTGPGVSQEAVDLITSLFARFQALQKLIYNDSPTFKLPRSPLNAAEDAKALGKACRSLRDIRIYGSHFIRKDAEGWVLQEGGS